MVPSTPPDSTTEGALPDAATTTRPLRLAVMDAAGSDKWRGLTEKYVRDSFGHPHDTLRMFDVVRGEVPTLQDLQEGQFDAVVLSGSPHSAYDDLPWIHQLSDLLKAVVASGAPRVLAICFGHQLLSQALGGLVTKNPSGKFVLKVEDVAFDASALRRCGLYDALAHEGLPVPPESASSPASARHGDVAADTPAAHERVEGERQGGQAEPLSSTSSLPVTYPLIESHGDQVVRLPEGAVLLASSATATCEMWSLPGRCLACQFHAEFPGTDVVLEKIHPLLTAIGKLDAAGSKDSELSLRTATPKPKPVRSLFRAFMEGAAGSVGAEPRDAAAAPSPAAEPPARPEAPPSSSSAQPSPSGPAQNPAGGSGAGEMEAELHQLVGHMRSAFNTGLQQGSAQWDLLSSLNQQAAAKCADMATAAEALSVFSQKLSEKQAGAQAALDTVPDLETQLKELSHAVDALDVQSKQLAQSVGLPDTSMQGAVFAWR